MSFLKNILKPFVEFKEGQGVESVDVDPKPAEKEKVEIKDTVSVTAPAASTQPNPSTTSNISATPGADYLDYFEKLIEEANEKNPLFQGTDFKEFIDSKIDVEAITDERTRYKTAFNVLKRTGLTKERLATTGREY